jgi:hypothetical protein
MKIWYPLSARDAAMAPNGFDWGHAREVALRWLGPFAVFQKKAVWSEAGATYLIEVDVPDSPEGLLLP